MKIHRSVHTCALFCVKSVRGFLRVQGAVIDEIIPSACFMFSICAQCPVFGHTADQSNIPHYPWLIQQVDTFNSYNKFPQLISVLLNACVSLH